VHTLFPFYPQLNVLRSWRFLVAAPVFLAVGLGLAFSLNTTTSEAEVFGFQILAGIGIGLEMQN
jgi:hypothetical protein